MGALEVASPAETGGLLALHDLPAPAKLNLFLHIVGRRADGYHRLQSVFALIDWADHIHLHRRSDAVLLRHDLGTTLPPDDLCLQAARALQQASGTHFGAEIHIDKRVPSGAGMGGGSSDAATVLLGLNRLWALGWSTERLAELGLALGADVPFFVHGRNALVEGIGERITPLPEGTLRNIRLAVVKPPQSLPTAAIFTDPLLRRDTAELPAAAIVAGFAGCACASSNGLQNDLQTVAERHCPEVAQATRWLQARFGNGRMTGSGSAVFANVNRIESGMAAAPVAMSAEAALQGLPSGWVGRMCHSLDRHPLVGWAG